jgi:hypothetical protein
MYRSLYERLVTAALCSCCQLQRCLRSATLKLAQAHNQILLCCLHSMRCNDTITCSLYLVYDKSHFVFAYAIMCVYMLHILVRKPALDGFKCAAFGFGLQQSSAPPASNLRCALQALGVRFY